MESKKAYEQLLKISKNKKFEILSDYLKNSKPVKINTTSLNFVPYLISVVVSQQLSTKAAKTIWSRVMPLISKSTQSKNFRENLRIAGLSGSKATYVIGLLENKELKKMVLALGGASVPVVVKVKGQHKKLKFNKSLH